MTLPLSSAGRTPFAARAVAGLVRTLDRIPLAPVALVLRLGVALVFWRSAMTKLASWQQTIMLFEEEYQVPLLPPEAAAYLASGVELAGPVMLLLGLGARLAAAGMLGMTLVIQLFVYPDAYPSHLLWAGPLLYVLLRGPGAWSIDAAIRRSFMAAR